MVANADHAKRCQSRRASSGRSGRCGSTAVRRLGSIRRSCSMSHASCGPPANSFSRMRSAAWTTGHVSSPSAIGSARRTTAACHLYFPTTTSTMSSSNVIVATPARGSSKSPRRTSIVAPGSSAQNSSRSTLRSVVRTSVSEDTAKAHRACADDREGHIARGKVTEDRGFAHRTLVRDGTGLTACRCSRILRSASSRDSPLPAMKSSIPRSRSFAASLERCCDVKARMRASCAARTSSATRDRIHRV